jgi:peptidoglycan/xylan/chitin deacetylase (PgdA/CDA1 family)
MSRLQRYLAQNRIVALTYDDGPSAEVTPQVLDLLGNQNANATFFLLGQHAVEYPHIANRIVREGHDVGCHSDQHLNAWKVAPWRAIADVEDGYDRLLPWVPSSGMFRPPYGKLTLPTYWAIHRRRGASVWWWTVDSGDTYTVQPRPVEVINKVRQQGGGIVLMHDGSILPQTRERQAYVLELTEMLLHFAKSESFKVMPLGQLCR